MKDIGARQILLLVAFAIFLLAGFDVTLDLSGHNLLSVDFGLAFFAVSFLL